MVGDDARGLLHDRHPVRVRHAGDKNRPLLEAVDLVRIFDDADRTGGNALANGKPADEALALFLEFIMPELRCFFL